MSSNQTIQLLFLIIIALTLAACGKTPSARFYTLSSMASQGTADHVSKKGKIIIGIGPVDIAAYLDRAEIVTRSSSTTIELASFDRWAEPFEGMIANSLAENISTMLPSVQAIVDPWPEADIDYQLVIKIKKFDSDKDGNIQLHASWGILQNSTRKISSVTESKISVPGSAGDYDAIAINMSRALVKLGEEIAAELKNIEKY
jgi:uncharacterized lipoprotein YmbA